MKKLLLVVTILFFSIEAISQSGNHVFSGSEAGNFETIDLSTPGGQTWSTYRGSTPGYFSAVGTGIYVGPADTKANVDGYVKYYKNSSNVAEFNFPVGTGDDLRTLSISGNIPATGVFATAWIVGDPSGNLDPTLPNAGAHAVSSFGTDLLAVSPIGQWDWQDVSGNAAGMTVTASIPDMTSFSSPENLRLVGWNGSEWQNLSLVQGSLAANSNVENSTLEGTMVSGITAIGIGKVLNVVTGVPDLNPAIEVVPGSGIAGSVRMGILLNIKELLGSNSDPTEQIIVTVSKSIYYTMNWPDFATATSLPYFDFTGLENSDWTFSETGSLYIWTYNKPVFNANDISNIGFEGTWNAGTGTGTNNFTVTIVNGSGGEVRFGNNVDVARIRYTAP